MSTETRIAPLAETAFLDNVVKGLSQPVDAKHIPSRYLYDEHGCQLFESICQTPEYYLTRIELEIMQHDAEEMAALCGPRCRLVELGSGASVKTQLLLDQLVEPAAYIPVDIAPEYLVPSTHKLSERYAGLDIRPVCANFVEPFQIPDVAGSKKTVIYFPGSTIGNFEPPAVVDLLSNMRRHAAPDGGILVGMDLKKDRSVLEAAYNDSAGVTAEFTCNLLRRLKRELGAEVETHQFQHLARYNDVEGRIEIYLCSTHEQTIRVGEHCFEIEAGELIRTEYSYKYDLTGIEQLAQKSGTRLTHRWLDKKQWFGLFYFQA